MPKILIMDDEPALLNIVYSIVKPLGHPIFKAEDGKTAIELGKIERPDIALLDMRVPDMDGLEVLTVLRKMNPDIKCIMLSGFGDSETIANALKEGAFSYLSKPFKIDEVLATVKKALDAVAEIKKAEAAQAASFSSSAEISAKKLAFSSPAVKIGAGAAAVVILFAVAAKFIFSTQQLTEYGINYTHPSAVCSIMPNILVSEWVSGVIYEHDPSKQFAQVHSNNILNNQPSGLAYDGEFVWSCNTQEKKIYKHRNDERLTVIQIFALSDEVPDALFSDGVNLWVLDGSNGKIYKHKLDDRLSLLDSFDSPSDSPCGMFKDGEYFYIGDYKTGKIFKVSADGLRPSKIYIIPYLKEKDLKLSSIALDGNNIWFSTNDNPKILKLPLKNLKEIKL